MPCVKWQINTMTAQMTNTTAVGPDIPGLVAALRATFATGRTRPVEWRRAQLRALEKLMTENETRIAEALNMTVAGIMAHVSALKGGEWLKIPQYRL